MRLRKLVQNDAQAMLKWMHDPNITAKMGTDFQNKTLKDCHVFIKNAQHDSFSIHRAIVNEKDEYLGTVSLKNINKSEKNAEFAIVICKKAMGKGFAAWAMSEILNFGKNSIGLKKIFWCVRKDNIRANKFYKKNGYRKTEDIPVAFANSYDKGLDLNWFVWGE